MVRKERRIPQIGDTRFIVVRNWNPFKWWKVSPQKEVRLPWLTRVLVKEVYRYWGYPILGCVWNTPDEYAWKVE